MPLPKIVGRFNRKVTNRIARPLAGRVPPFAMVVHRGRRSGREYQTPIFAFPCEDGFLIALTYGTGTDWERNIRAAGGELIYRGQRYRLGEPVAVGQDAASPCLPAPVRIVLRWTRTGDFLQIPVTTGRS